MNRPFILLASAAVGAAAVSASADPLDSFTLNIPGPFSYTTGRFDPYPIVDAGVFSVDAGTYHGLRVTYTVESTDPSARLFDMPIDLYNPDQSATFASSLMENIRPNVAAGEIGTGPREITLDLPIFFFRSFNQAPTAFTGGMDVGLRGINRSAYSTATWSDISIEFYEGIVSTVSGDTASTGTWNRPSVNPDLGIDNGRESEETSYTAIEFTVDTDGTYGIHTQFFGDFPRDGWTFVFEGDAPITGDYSNLLDADDQGLFGVGYTDIDSIELIAGQSYTLVLGNADPGDVWDFESYFVGPGSVTVIPTPDTAGMMALAGVLTMSRRRR